ncbi:MULTISPECIES: hypothetical protein [Pseudomonas]|jgi:hypothetical protein|uniref:Uncharacterized protein n=2 Tax=Pseudomonas fluorescens group TaxID=136843 RepID=A0AAE8L2P3_9PSED|nr:MULTISPECIES: hypothetical protein [Pseudomonas]OHC62156.1 MAG: hypothetical protein A3J25_03790 [Pseudomonadales bacterium RIFCSPLOWO2_02_FULL_63_210]ASI38154.1 Hypothetical protein [Pseudomonas fluorescens]EKF8205636.1 hypothetical protein [Pseudomonas aeruginosa]EKI0126958.1 hypothetical protein [Pseudomonas aeruginosa]EMD6030916.1 hypothetical protein [Pseudomonas aeruginosa]
MDDVGKARARKFAESLRHASWVIDDEAAGARNAVGFWLYSYNLVAGPRLVGQLTLDGYRAMQSGEDLKNLDGLQPADVLGATLSAYDALPERSRNAGESQTVISALSLYASSTMTWQALPPLKTGAHQHFMVFDWLTASGKRIFRPAAAITGSVLAPEILTDFSKQVLTAHLSKHPHETPY